MYGVDEKKKKIALAYNIAYLLCTDYYVYVINNSTWSNSSACQWVIGVKSFI